MSAGRGISALQLSMEQVEVLYCAAMLGMVVAFQHRIEATPDTIDKAKSWADTLREIGEEKVVLTVNAYHAMAKGAA